MYIVEYKLNFTLRFLFDLTIEDIDNYLGMYLTDTFYSREDVEIKETYFNSQRTNLTIKFEVYRQQEMFFNKSEAELLEEETDRLEELRLGSFRVEVKKLENA